MRFPKLLSIICLSLFLIGCYKAVDNGDNGIIVINQFNGDGYLVDDDGYKKSIADISTKKNNKILSGSTTTVREKINIEATVKFTRDKEYIRAKITAENTNTLEALRNDYTSRFFIRYFDSDNFMIGEAVVYPKEATGTVDSSNKVIYLTSNTEEDCTQYILNNVSYLEISWSISDSIPEASN